MYVTNNRTRNLTGSVQNRDPTGPYMQVTNNIARNLTDSARNNSSETRNLTDSVSNEVNNPTDNLTSCKDKTTKTITKPMKIATWNKGGHWASKLKNRRVGLETMIREHDLDLIVIPESNTNRKDKINIPGYEILQGHEEINRICVVVKLTLNAKLIKIGTETPYIHLKIYKNAEEIDIVGLYREYKKFGERPRRMSEQINYWTRYLQEMSEIKCSKMIWLGDFNLDWNQKTNRNYDKKTMLDMLVDHSYKKKLRQQVKSNTRIVNKGSSKIDLVFTKTLQVKNTVTTDGNSDHELVIMTLKEKYKEEVKPVYARDWSGFSKEKLIRAAQKINWREVNWEPDLNKAWEMLLGKMETVTNETIPFKMKYPKSKIDWNSDTLRYDKREKNKQKNLSKNYQDKI